MKKFSLVLFALMFAMVVFGNTIEVYPGESIQGAIDIVSDNDTVYVHNGTYTETLSIVGKSILLIGESSAGCIIRAQSAGVSPDAVIYANSYTDGLVTIENLTVRQGYSGISVNNAPYCYVELINVISTGNDYGMLFNSSSVDMYNCSIIDNNYRGINISYGNINIFDSSVTNNNFSSSSSISQDGGGICLESQTDIFLSGVVIADNYAYRHGGGLSIGTASNVVVFDEEYSCVIENNQANIGDGDDLYATYYEPGTTVIVYTESMPDAYPLDYWIITAPSSVDAVEGGMIVQKRCLNYPNPVKSTTNIMFSNVESLETSIEVFNVRGQKVLSGKSYSDRLTIDMSKMSSGVYYYRVKNSRYQEMNKMIVVK